jgi:RimJ/RimL family protein N-acetyltransferase
VFIRSERLFLRPIWPEDLAELDFPVDHMLAGMARVAPRHPRFAVTLPDTRHGGAALIGVAALADCDGETELAIRIASAWRNCGLGTEAASAVLTLARALGHRRIVACPFAESPAGARLLAQLGFVPTAHLRLRHNPDQGVHEPVPVHALALCPPISGPVDPAEMRRAA